MNKLNIGRQLLKWDAYVSDHLFRVVDPGYAINQKYFTVCYNVQRAIFHQLINESNGNLDNV